MGATVTGATAANLDGSRAPILAASRLCVGYGPIAVVHDVDIEVRPGEVVALLGPNGAGKSTTLLALSGDLPITSGEVRFDGVVTKAPLHKRARQGMAIVTEDRSLFMRLSAADNLRAGKADVEAATNLFPELSAFLNRQTGLLSGGQQQMLTLGRAIARHPRVLLADELSLGLAPLVVERLLKAVRQAADEGVGVLLVEQHVRKALEIADRVYVMRRGRVVLTGDAADIRERVDEIEDVYMSTGTSVDAEADAD